MDERQSARLELLKRRGNPGVAALVAEYLPPLEALRFVSAYDEGWARLIEARALFKLGRLDEASRVLEETKGLPPALEKLSEKLKLAVAAALEPAREDPGLLALKDWLYSVRSWRAKLGV